MIGMNARKPQLLDVAALGRMAGRPLSVAPVTIPTEISSDQGSALPDQSADLSAMPAPQMKGPTVWDRVNDAIKAPGMSGAFLRAAGAAFNGDGLGGAIQAGTGYMDQQKALETAADQRAIENELAARGMDLRELQSQQQNDLGWAGVGVDVGRLNETGRSNRAREAIDANGQRVQLYGIDSNAATTRRGQDLNFQSNQDDNATTQRGQDLSYNANIYGTNLNYLGDQARGAAGIGSKGGYTQSQTKIPGKPASGGWFGMGGTEATPETIITTRAPLLSGAVPGGAVPPPPAAIQALKANPNLRGQFDAKYGAGASAQYLGGR